MMASHLIARDSRIESGCDEIRIEGTRATPQAIELDLAIAHHAWIRRVPREIFRNEISDDSRIEILAQIDDVKWKAHHLGHPTRIFEIVMRAASASTLGGRHRSVGCETHRYADDIA